jgi:hypothetical protein
MKNTLSLIAVLAALSLTSCSTVDSALDSSRSIGKAAIGGTGNIVGNAASDASKTLGVASESIGKVVSGAGKVLGGSLDVAGSLVKGTSDIVAPSVVEKK